MYLLIIILLCACNPSKQPSPTMQNISRDLKIPAGAIKILPQMDLTPPISLSNEYDQPVPVPGLVNTAGGEDSPFIMPDGKTLYIFFTPDVSISAQDQVTDGVTGIYVSKLTVGGWQEPQRIILQEPGKLAVDGCEFILENWMWFCSAREGFEGLHWFTAELVHDTWQNWQIADFDPAFQVGELHISLDGNYLFFASNRPGGKGAGDIWYSRNLDGKWQEPINLALLNTPDSEGWPALNPAGDELWFSRNYGIWRSKLVNDQWQTAELIISPLAGEPSVDASGNVYFTHHYFKDDQMLEADIYVAFKK